MVISQRSSPVILVRKAPPDAKNIWDAVNYYDERYGIRVLGGGAIIQNMKKATDGTILPIDFKNDNYIVFDGTKDFGPMDKMMMQSFMKKSDRVVNGMEYQKEGLYNVNLYKKKEADDNKCVQKIDGI